MLNEFSELTPLRKVFIVLVALVCLLAVLHFIVSEAYLPLDIRSSDQWGWDFRNNLWSPAHLLLDGKSPYRIDQLFDANSVWLPMVIGTFLPLGALSLPIASNIWFVLNGMVLALLLALSIRRPRPNPLLLAVCLVGLFLFPPLVSHMMVGQFSLMTALLCLVAAELLARHKASWWVALPVALALSKPQLMVLAIPALLVGCYVRGGWRETAKFAAALAGWCLLMSLPLWLGFPGWIDGFIWAFERNQVWIQPSTLQVLRTAFGTVGIILWGILAIAALILTGWLWHKFSPPLAMLWTLALTVLVTPYVWTWDFVLMLPLLVYTLFNSESRIARAVWVAGFAACWLLLLIIRTQATSIFAVSDEQFWWVSWMLMGIILATMGVNRLFPREKAKNADDSQRQGE